MVNWIVIGIIAVAFLIFVKTTGFRYGRSITYLIGGVLIFFAATLIYTITVFPLDVSNFDNTTEFVRFYFSWIANLFSTTSSVTGNVIKEYSSNVTNFSK